MELLHNLAVGFGVALTPANLVFALTGALIGTLIGVLPGIGPIATIAMLLPLTFHLEPTSGLIMLAGIFYGAQYGGSTTAILVNLPGETSSVVTCIDGHQMARQGRAGAALAVAALGSFFAGCVSTTLIATFAPPLAKVGQSFGAPEYFSLMVLGLIAAVVLAHGSVIKAIAMIVLGLLVGLVGTDGNTGGTRFTFGITELTDGIDVATLAIGIFGVGEIITNLTQPRETRSLATQKITRLWPTREDFGRAWPAVLRGTGLGSILGVLPGGGATLSAFAAYALEKRWSKNPAQFGHGAVEGVAGPESANNAGAQTSFIPMLTLGIPGNAVMALMIGALTIHGIQPGPQIMSERPGMFWGMIASMWIGNLMLVIINLPLIGIWVQLLKVPYRFLYLAILLFCGIGVYTVSNSAAAVLLAAFFGVLGYVFTRLERRPGDFFRAADQPRLVDRSARALRAGRAAGHPQQARRGVSGIGASRPQFFTRSDTRSTLLRSVSPRAPPTVTPGTTSIAIPARRQAAITSRPSGGELPPLSPTTRLPPLASAIISVTSSCCKRPVLPTSAIFASRRAKSRMSGARRSSIRMMSADCSARTARIVSSSASPGPAPTSVMLPASAAVAWSSVLRSSASKSDGAGSRCGLLTAKAANACQNRRRPDGESPEDCTAWRQRRAASAQRAKPRGIIVSSLARIAWPKTGAAPSVEMPMTSGERLTMAPKEKSQ